MAFRSIHSVAVLIATLGALIAVQGSPMIAVRGSPFLQNPVQPPTDDPDEDADPADGSADVVEPCQYTNWTDWRADSFTRYSGDQEPCPSRKGIVYIRVRRLSAEPSPDATCTEPLRETRISCLPSVNEQIELLQVALGGAFEGEPLPPSSYRPQQQQPNRRPAVQRQQQANRMPAVPQYAFQLIPGLSGPSGSRGRLQGYVGPPGPRSRIAVPRSRLVFDYRPPYQNRRCPGDIRRPAPTVQTPPPSAVPLPRLGRGIILPPRPPPIRQIPDQDGAGEAETNKKEADTEPTQETPIPPRQQQPGGNPRDIALVLDASGSVGKRNYEKAVENVAALLGMLCYRWPEVGQPSDVRFAVVIYSSTVRTMIDFKMSAEIHTNSSAIRDSILRAKEYWPCMGRSTATAPALRRCYDDIFVERNGMRANSKKRLLLLTDGKSNQGGSPVPVAEKLHREKNIDVFPIGVGTGVNLRELSSMKLFADKTGLLSKLLVLPDFSSLTSVVDEVTTTLDTKNQRCQANLVR